MIYRRSLLSAMNTNGLTVFIVLLAITLSVIAVRVLNDAAFGKIDQSLVLVYLVLGFFSASPYLVQLTGAMAILQVFQRLYADSEMVIWQGAGLPLHRFIPTVLRLLLPLCLLCAVLVLFVRPWSIGVSKQLNQQFRTSQTMINPSPGQFNPMVDNQGMLYIEDDIGLEQALQTGQGNASLRHLLFVRAQPRNQAMPSLPPDLYIGMAERGAIERNQNAGVSLHDGRLYALNFSPSELKVIAFDRLSLSAINPYQRESEQWQAMSTLRLIQNPQTQERAELMWRMSMVVQVLGMGLLALFFSYSPPRKRQYMNMVLLLCVGLIYYNLINIVQSLVAIDRINVWLGFLVLHGTFLLLAGLGVFARAYRFSSRRLIPNFPLGVF